VLDPAALAVLLARLSGIAEEGLADTVVCRRAGR
jgi:hypothetical protein